MSYEHVWYGSDAELGTDRSRRGVDVDNEIVRQLKEVVRQMQLLRADVLQAQATAP